MICAAVKVQSYRQIAEMHLGPEFDFLADSHFFTVFSKLKRD